MAPEVRERRLCVRIVVVLVVVLVVDLPSAGRGII